MLIFNIETKKEGAKQGTDPMNKLQEIIDISSISEIKERGSDDESEGEDQEEETKDKVKPQMTPSKENDKKTQTKLNITNEEKKETKETKKKKKKEKKERMKGKPDASINKKQS